MPEQFVLSVDPGWSTGVALIGYNDESAWLERAWQFSGGRAALAGWLNSSSDFSYGVQEGWQFGPQYFGMYENDLTTIVEKFTPHPNEKFSLTLRSVEPLVCEGTIIDRGLIGDYLPSDKHWRDPKLQYIVGGKDKADKKKRLHAFLKHTDDFYVTGKTVGQPNADDARSAMGHGLGYLARDLKHRGVFNLLRGWEQ